MVPRAAAVTPPNNGTIQRRRRLGCRGLLGGWRKKRGINIFCASTNIRVASPVQGSSGAGNLCLLQANYVHEWNRLPAGQGGSGNRHQEPPRPQENRATPQGQPAHGAQEEQVCLRNREVHWPGPARG